MNFVELIVNRPIRRVFYQPKNTPPSPLPALDSLSGLDGEIEDPAVGRDDSTTLQLFHYHLPGELEDRVKPGHLVWIPFGPQEVQGVVLRHTDHAPVPTRAILRLARPDPVLTTTQLTLATWIAEYYVAPLSESVKLFFPPGLLSKADGSTRVRAKRELKITLLLSLADALQRLNILSKETQQTKVLQWWLTHSPDAMSVGALQKTCQLKSASSIQTLAKHGIFEIVSAPVSSPSETEPQVKQVSERLVRLTIPEEAVHARLLELRGTARYRPILETLAAADKPLWRSELYSEVDANLSLLRALQKAGIIALQEEVRFRDPLAGRAYPQTTPPPLTPEQKAVWEQIETLCFANAYPVSIQQNDGAEPDTIPLHPNTHNRGHSAYKFLLHGVTGSGKTEIYLRAIGETLARGKQAIVLVPEIALTPQTVARFAGRFPGRVTVIHSGLSAGERYDVWRHLQAGEFDVVIGPRSALFAPLPRLGLIVIDEEHEASYKQNSEEWGSFTVFYDARTVAEQMADLTNSILLYGSATPSLERYLAATEGELILLELLQRVMGHREQIDATSAASHGEEFTTPKSQATATVNDITEAGESRGSTTNPTMAASPYTELPPVEIVDMRQELRTGHRSILSRSLLSALHATLDAGEQAIFYLNRRGTRTFVMCRDCGDVQQCRRCDVPLTFHENTNVLICHHCNQRVPIPEVCSQCSSKRIKYFGSGTQRLEEVIQQVAPHARLMRWDADTISGKGSHEEILRRFAAHEADILVGTQMIAKGLDFPMVTLVGVVAADIGLFLPDFRSGERVFQLLTQVAGRAGRGERGGRVIIQSYRPDHYAIQAAAQHDYHAFYTREIAFREDHGYPPVRPMARLIYWDKKLEKAQEASNAMADLLRTRLVQLGIEGEGATVLGPAPAFFARYRGYYRWQILLRAPQPAHLLRGVTIPFGWRVDIDPVSML